MDSTTIRDHIKRRVRLAFGVAVAGWLMFPLLTVANHGRGPVPSMFVAASALFAGAMLYVQWFVR